MPKLAGKCPVTDCYYEHCMYDTFQSHQSLYVWQSQVENERSCRWSYIEIQTAIKRLPVRSCEPL